MSYLHIGAPGSLVGELHAHDREARLADGIRRTSHRLLATARLERTLGVALVAATAAALLWANAAPSSYARAASLRLPVNEGAMGLFFLLVGLEIRRELVAGELGSWHRAARPVVAAVAGMLVPAAIYALVVGPGPSRAAWGVPIATDIAFSLGALTLCGARVSKRIRSFLLTLAVTDDVLAIAVLAAFYGTRHAGAYIVGLVVGLALPSRRLGPRRLERALVPWVNVLVLPAFALLNAGVRLRPSMFQAPGATRVLVAVVIARVAGKVIGIGVVGHLMDTARSSRRPPLTIYASAGAFAAAGFTVPLLFVAAAMPEGNAAEAARAGLLLATIGGAVLGATLHRRG